LLEIDIKIVCLEEAAQRKKIPEIKNNVSPKHVYTSIHTQLLWVTIFYQLAACTGGAASWS